MKTTKIIYWVSTVLFGGFMLFSAVPDIISDPQAIEFFKQLQLPAYLLPFIGIAKALGVVALFVPGFPRVREWAYAGLFFDLVGAAYCATSSGAMPASGLLFFAAVIAVEFVSYFSYHKLQSAKMKPLA